MYSIPELTRMERNVVFYARVSTEHEAQLSALENQIDWYKPIMDAHPEWHLVGQYIDEGVTGTSAEKREAFMRMIADAHQHKFDLIITREVSRFARNTPVSSGELALRFTSSMIISRPLMEMAS